MKCAVTSFDDVLHELNKEIFYCDKKCDNLIGFPYPMYIGNRSDFSIMVVGQSPGMAFRDNDPILKTYDQEILFFVK